ncbi:MAG TPA: T9SS type A sorting domain-containing protein, partial [Bacteroidetes bacterium]|nr:T9SS type A sorting domain-containing protein [Bacteroidota bacterium]
ASITGGAYLSLDSGHSFFEIGLAGLSVSSIALNASNTQIYAVAYNSGIWKGHIPAGLGSGILTVTNTNDSGANTLREAITSANRNPGPDSIRFAIPKSDPGFEPATGAWRIRVLNALPDITDAGLTIDGSSQNEFTGEDSNPAGPEIIIDGSAAGDFTIAFNILTSDVEIKQLCINGFGDCGISMFGENTRGNTVTGCYIGTDAAGKTAKPNDRGIFIQETAANTISGNLISGNDKFGIYIMGAASQNNVISGNLIGTDITGNNDLGNGWTGISINSDKNTIGGSSENKHNIISGNGQDGISIRGNMNVIQGNLVGTDVTGSSIVANDKNGIMVWAGQENIIGGQEPGESNIIAGNHKSGILVGDASETKIIGNAIGTDSSGTQNMGNDGLGIGLFYGASNGIIGPGNIVAFNTIGIQVYGDSSIQNTITQNSITANDGYGIANESGGNANLAPPVIFEIKNGTVTGAAPPGSVVEIFSDDDDEGKIYEGMTTADAGGNFEWNGAPAGPFVTATATDSAGNTSQFSQPKNVTSVAETAELIIPMEFSLSQNYPNPFNPVTKIQFALPLRSKVTLKVYNFLGEALSTLIDGNMPAGTHTLLFDGEQLSSGIYFYRLQATDARNARTFTQTLKLTLLK